MRALLNRRTMVGQMLPARSMAEQAWNCSSHAGTPQAYRPGLPRSDDKRRSRYGSHSAQENKERVCRWAMVLAVPRGNSGEAGG